LLVQGKKVIEVAKQKQSTSAEVKQTGEYFSHVETVHAEQAQERQENPGKIIINRSRYETVTGLPLHRGNQEQIDNPADKEEAKGEEPDDPCYLFTIVEAMGSDESEDPEQVA